VVAPVAAAGGGVSASQRAGTIAVQVWLPILLITAWWIASAHSTNVFYPPLGVIGQHFATLYFSASFVPILLESLSHLASGYALASILGITFGVLIASNRWLRYAAAPFLSFLRSLPSIAVMPLMIVLLGTGAPMKAGIIVWGSIWYVLLNTIDGIRGIDPARLEMARVYRLTRWERIRHVLVPGAAPQIAAGLRVGLQIGILLMIVSEIRASTSGIGYMILDAKNSFRMPDMWAGMVLLSIVGLTLNTLFVMIERRALHWYFGYGGIVRR
jgi:ABC-type nitrate/sulfonate/bicarbonate transport system permease component